MPSADELGDELERRSSAWLIDAALAAGATAILQVAVFLPAPEKPAPSLAIILFNLLLTLPLLVRSRAPFSVMTTIFVSATLPAAFPEVGSGALAWIPLAIAVNGVGHMGRSRLRILALAIQPLGSVFREFTVSENPDISFVILESALLVFAWFAGDQLRLRQRYIKDLEERAARLEMKTAEDTSRVVSMERARIARELHDLITHSVSAIAVQAGAARMSYKGDRSSALESLNSIEVGSRQALVEMRRLLGLLKTEDDRSLALAPQPTLSRLDLLLDQMRERGLEVELEINGEPPRLSPGLDLSAYRVIEEALAAAAEHASKSKLRVVYGPRDLELEVKYPAPESQDKGFTGIRERVALFGGDFEAKGRRDGDFVVRARLPLVA